MTEKTYPISYDKFKDKLLQAFFSKDWKYEIHFTKQQKQEFIDNNKFDFRESYQEECDNYDKGNPNVFDNPMDTIKYIYGLLFDCEQYFASKNNNHSMSEKAIDESKYPMTYEEFEKKLGDAFIKESPHHYRDITEDKARKDWKEFLKTEGSQRYIYEEMCERYDKAGSSGKKKIFSDDAIRAAVSPLIDWVYF